MERRVKVLLDFLFYISVAFLLAKNSNVIYLIGIGVGFSLTSWVIYKVYSTTSRRKRPRHPSCESNSATTGSRLQKTSGIEMGNTKSISAGISLGEINNLKDLSSSPPGVRHRNGLSINNNNNQRDSLVTASIIEDDSGAYISRSAYKSDVVTDRTNHLAYQEQETEPNAPQVIVPHEAVTMNDSGYLELDTQYNTRMSDTAAGVAQTSFIEESGEKICLRTTNALGVSSIRSSLSDQLIHDLGSECDSISSYRGFQGDDLQEDEDVLSVEIYHKYDEDVTLNDPDTASTTTLLGSLLQSSDGDDPSEISTATSASTASTDLEMGNKQQSFHSPLLRSAATSRASDTKDSWTDSSDFWRELDEMSSPFSLPSPRNPQALRLSMENLCSSGNSSPLFVPKANHSRTSSITSADIDLDADCADTETRDDIETIEMELVEIKQEMCEVEDKLNQLMSIDTTQLYFNVDNMKKLTEVVLGSDDIELTSSEIAKAFHILRKYRYTFTSSTDKSSAATLSSNEAEILLSPNTSHKKSLPYLDLADTSFTKSSPSRGVMDWADPALLVSSPKTNKTTSCLTMPKQVATEWEIESYCKCQPMLQQGYEELSDAYGFSTVCLLKIDQSAFEGAAYMSLIIHNETGYLKAIDVDNLCQKLDTMIQDGHDYLESWDFQGMNLNGGATLSTMSLCLKTLLSQTKRLSEIEDEAERRSDVLNLFNITANIRSLMIEGIKLLVFLKVNNLYTRYVAGDDFPLYTWLLFARETSCNPRSYFQNHIQQPNNYSKPDQIDVQLLADTLRVNLQTFHPVKAGRDDFMSTSQTSNSDWSAEDHSNLVPLAIHSSSSYAVLY